MADLFTTIETPLAKYEQPLGLYVSPHRGLVLMLPPHH